MDTFVAKESGLWIEGASQFPYAKIKKSHGAKIAETLNLGQQLPLLQERGASALAVPARTRCDQRNQLIENLPMPDPTLGFERGISFRADGRLVFGDLGSGEGAVISVEMVRTDHIGKAKELARLLNAGVKYRDVFNSLLQFWESATELSRAVDRWPEA